MAQLPLRILAAVLIFAAALGFSRFSYGVLLPSMQADFHGTYALFGLIAAANFSGNLAGNAAIPFLLRVHGSQRGWNTGALITMSAAMIATGFITHLATLLMLRFIIGAAGGAACIFTMSLALQGQQERTRGVVTGAIWSGAALGILVCGLTLPPLTALHLSGLWRTAWVTMGVLSLLATLFFDRLHNQSRSTVEGARERSNATGKSSAFYALAAAYALFGCGYIIFLTYAPTHWDKAGFSSNGIAASWCLLGAAGVVGPAIWGKIFDALKSPIVLSLSLSACGVASIIGFGTGRLPTMAAALLTGFAMLGPPTVITAMAKSYASAGGYVVVLSRFGTAFAGGQIFGPLIGGIAADRLGVGYALLLSGAVLLCGAVVAGLAHVSRASCIETIAA